MPPRRKPFQAPDGAPKPASEDRDRSSRSQVSVAQDPMISRDAGGPALANADEPVVDEAGGVRKDTGSVDLLH